MSQWALRRLSHRGFQPYFALFALLAIACTAVLLQGRSVSSDAPALSAPADIPSTKTSPAGDGAKQAAGVQAKLPLAFVANRGQTHQSVRYYTQGSGLNGAAQQTPATADDLPFPFNINCSATGSSESGACNVQTTADAVTADAVQEGKRAVWELGQVKVYDGGSDADADTTGDNTLFEVQGLFAP
jgi:hypothetical protein